MNLPFGVLDGMARGLTVGDLRLADVAVDVELTTETVDDDLEVQLAHAGDDGLAGLLVGVDLEGRVLLGELGEADAHLVLLGLGLRLDRDVDDGVGELDGLEDDGVSLVAQRVTGTRVLETHGCDDVAGVAGLTVDTVVGVHLEDAAQALALVLGGVIHVAAGLGMARVDAEVGELADEGVGHDLECQRREGLVRISLASDGVAGLGLGTLDVGHVERAGEIVDDSVEELLDALVLVGGAHEDEVELVGDDALAKGRLQHVDGDVLLLEGELHDLVGEVSGRVEKLAALGSRELGELVGDGVQGLRIDHALVVFLEVPGGHRDEVDETPELVLGSHGNLGRDGRCAQAILHGVDGMEEVRAHAVVLVDEGDAGDVVVVGLAPDRLGLGLDACDGVEDRDGTVEDAQRALDLGREVDVTRGVDDLDDVVLPEARRSSAGDGDAALLLLDHPVHDGSAVVDLADLMGLAGVIQDSLGGRRLAGIDVRHDADVTHVLELVLALCHGFLLLGQDGLRSGSARTRGWPLPSCRGPHGA
jgi:hypothetical protein